VNVDGVWIGNRSYWTLKQLVTTLHRKHRSSVAFAIVVTLMSYLLCHNLVTALSSVIFYKQMNGQSFVAYAFHDDVEHLV
jgi:hypothetical protein